MEKNPTNHYEPEWLGEDELDVVPPPKFFRLVVASSDILPRAQRLVMIDAHDEVYVGRDAMPGQPRIRLKEMAVSKHHASIFWGRAESEDEGWHIVDLGSLHGTFVRPSSNNEDPPSSERGRLSEPRKASTPRVLCHLDNITIASTRFVAHLHENPPLPCDECALLRDEEQIILLKNLPPVMNTATTLERLGPISKKDDPQQAIKSLKKSLLAKSKLDARPIASSSSEIPSIPLSTYKYVDRAAKRRAAVGSTPIYHTPSHSRHPSPLPFLTHPESSWSPTYSHAPPNHAPLPTSNIGHRLLLKQGWDPGNPLGISSNNERQGLVEPLRIVASVERGGLGSGKTIDSGESLPEENWRQAGKKRRWQEY